MRRGRPGNPDRVGGTQRRDRGQTTLDYAVGIVVFIVAVTFVLTFIPGMFEPFTGGAQENTVLADRLGTQLVDGGLTRPDSPFVLNQNCTTSFFANTTAASYCGFVTPNPLHERLGISDDEPVNVSVSGDFDGDGDQHILCEAPNDAVREVDAGSCSTTFAAGGDPPEASGTVTVARRSVRIDGETAILEVRVWG